MNNSIENREDWIKKCAARLHSYYWFEQSLAEEIALSCLENLQGDTSEDPIDAADEEMSYWNDD